ncbi:hypothetical protein [Weissella cibaria]|nr:hypothetical protein [Weissella cibaria]
MRKKLKQVWKDIKPHVVQFAKDIAPYVVTLIASIFGVNRAAAAA